MYMYLDNIASHLIAITEI